MGFLITTVTQKQKIYADFSASEFYSSYKKLKVYVYFSRYNFYVHIYINFIMIKLIISKS